MAVTQEYFKNWDKKGKYEFLNYCKKASNTDFTSPVFTANENHVSDLTRAIYDLIWSGLNGVIKKEAVVSTLTEIISYHKDVSSIITDVINVIDTETTSQDSLCDSRSSLGVIVKATEKILTDKLLKHRLEIDSLQEFKILSNRNFYTKFIKVKTKLYYKQRKFNLFREESEGYAKLIAELNQDFSEQDNPSNLLEIIKSLIGCFNLDPNRVLDVMLDAFEKQPKQVDFFTTLIHNYMPDPTILCEVLAFKLSFYQSEPVPSSLYTVIALMLQHSIIALDDIYCWLTPDDRVICNDWEKEMKDASEYVRKLNVVSTKSDNEKVDQPEETVNDYDKYTMNQKFRLCEALLQLGDWKTCEAMCRRLPNFCVLDQPPIAIAMCKLLHSLIEPLYIKSSTLGPSVRRRGYSIPTSQLSARPVHSFLDMRAAVIPMLCALGPSLHHDMVLVSKLIRILKSALDQAKVDVNSPPPVFDSLYYDTISVLEVAILPSLSYVDANCCLAELVWGLLKLFPYQIRYALYNSWKNETYQQHAKLLRRKGDILKRIKFVMKRVSKETIKPMGRQIGKLTHSSPGFLFDYMLLQIQTYDNLIVPVVDALKYMTSISFDVLCYCIVETLSSAEKDRNKHDGISLSPWLQSLSTFCGCLFRKYPTDLTGIVQFLANQLKQQKSFDMLVLNEIVQKMAGIEAADEMTNEQMEAMAGGDLLKGEAGYYSQVRNTKRSSQRLKEALGDDLAVALCLLMAQQRYCIIYRETENTHLKLVGKLYDQCQDTLVQFGTFLGSVLSIEDYINKLPSIHLLLSEYHIHMDVAFFLARPMFNHAINQKYEALRKADGSKKVLKSVRYCEAVTEVMGAVAASVRPLHPPKVWEDISPQFLTTFWSLSMSDLTVPVQAYDREIAKVRQLQAAASCSKELNASKQKKEVERLGTLVDKLLDEKRKQQDHVDRVMIRLKQEKDVWFLSRSAKSAKNETITQLLQLCLFPRCLFTCVDALYCAKFVHILHSLQTANFSTLLCYDRLFCDITYSVTSCTENEANRYGRFLCSMLETVMRWHSKKEIFDEECASYPGFVTKFRVSNQFSESNDNVGYENYRHVCHKWHYKITKAIIVCLESQDYVQIRNSLIILIRILPHFPVLTKLAQCIEKKIEKIKEEEKNKRQDLYVLATSYSGHLKSRASFIMRESDFHLVQQVKSAEVKTDVTTQPPASVSSSSSSKQVNGDVRQDKEKPSSTVPDVKKDSNSKEKRLNRTVSDIQPPSNKPSTDNIKKESLSVKINKEKMEKMREKEQLEKEKQQRKEERQEARREEARREEMKKRAAEEKGSEERERSSSTREDKHRDERYTEMPLSKDEEIVTRGSYYGYYPPQLNDSQLSSVSTSSSGSLRQTPDNERESKRRKMEASITSKKHEERKITTVTSETSASSLVKADKKERREKLKKSGRMEEEKELKKERKLNRKRERLDEAVVNEQKRIKNDDKVSSKLSSSHQNGDHSEPHVREKRAMQKEKSPYVRERSHDRDGRDKHRRSGEAKRR